MQTVMVVRHLFLVFIWVAVLSTLSCSKHSAETGRRDSSGQRIDFWHTRHGNNAKVLNAICTEFEAANPGIHVVGTYQGNYDDLNKKLRASIQTDSLPVLAAAYPNQVTEYEANGVVRPLDDLFRDRQVGFTSMEMADIPSPYLADNRFPQFHNQLLSFPFTKNILVMYFNRSLLRKNGFRRPPATWPEFEDQAAVISRCTGKPAVAFTIDPSTIDGMIYSQGGTLVSDDGRRTLFDQPAAINTMKLLQRMSNRRTLKTAGYDDAVGLFASQQCAYMLTSSSAWTSFVDNVPNKFDWDLAIIPHAPGIAPATVMYGPNICIFRSTQKQEKTAWMFIKYFSSPIVTARWARETGYLPVRKSALSLPGMGNFYIRHPYALHAYQAIGEAKGEPNVVGWQEVRGSIAEAADSVINGGGEAEAAAHLLKTRADDILTQSQRL